MGKKKKRNLKEKDILPTATPSLPNTLLTDTTIDSHSGTSNTLHSHSDNHNTSINTQNTLTHNRNTNAGLNADSHLKDDIESHTLTMVNSYQSVDRQITDTDISKVPELESLYFPLVSRNSIDSVPDLCNQASLNSLSDKSLEDSIGVMDALLKPTNDLSSTISSRNANGNGNVIGNGKDTSGNGIGNGKDTNASGNGIGKDTPMKGALNETGTTNATLDKGKETPPARSKISYNIFKSLKNELLPLEHLDQHSPKTDRISQFFSIPFKLEKFIFLAYLICLDSFLYTFTILPIRCFIALMLFMKSVFVKTNIHDCYKNDLLKGILLITCTLIMKNIDASRLYHTIRGQNLIKLYIVFGILEVLEKLSSAFGHDLLDSLFLTTTNGSTRKRIAKGVRFCIAIVYVTFHTIVLFYQAMCINVAINSYNNALLTLLMSNQFAEIKTSVFKKFEPGNLFQLSCADVIERFHLSIFLVLVSMRNLLEILGIQAFTDLSNYFLSVKESITMQAWDKFWTPFTVIDAFKSTFKDILESNQFQLVEIILGPLLFILFTEVGVDWIKHSFITKFNGVSPVVYDRFRSSLYRDLLGFRMHQGKLVHATPSNSNRSPIVARRIGFLSIPISCLVIRVVFQTLQNAGFLPETLAGESLEDESILEGELGTWKLPLKLHTWMKTMRNLHTGGTGLWLKDTFANVWGFIFAYLLLVCFKLLLGVYLRRTASSELQSQVYYEEAVQLDTFLGDHTPFHFNYPAGVKRDDSGEKLDSIERFTMVRSRIV